MIGYSERQVFPGGCFFASAAFEFNHRPGPVRDHIRDNLGSWMSYLEHAVEQAQDLGQLDRRVPASELAFQLDALAQAANGQYQLFRDEAVFARARRAIRERLESLRKIAA